jgi:uncharacterized protein (DUF3820 family)
MIMVSLTETDAMPVNGKHTGKPMGDVPASYLLWIADQPWCAKKYPDVLEYVNKIRDALEMEAEDDNKAYRESVHDG